MQGAAGQTAFGQVRINGGKAEGQGLPDTRHAAGEQPAQLFHDGGAGYEAKRGYAAKSGYKARE